MTAGKVPSDEEILFSIELLTIQQVATWARVSTKTIYRWIESGQIPVVKFGQGDDVAPGKLLVKRKEVIYECIIQESCIAALCSLSLSP